MRGGGVLELLWGKLFFDDLNSLVYNPDIHNLIPTLKSVQSNSISGRPVAEFLFALEYAAGGGSPALIFHATNLVIHLACGLVLFGIVRRNLEDEKFWGRRFVDSGQWVAAFVAALWVAHPLNTEAVTYIVQRTESLAGLFYLLVIYCLIRVSGRAAARVGDSGDWGQRSGDGIEGDDGDGAGDGAAV